MMREVCMECGHVVTSDKERAEHKRVARHYHFKIEVAS